MVMHAGWGKQGEEIATSKLTQQDVENILTLRHKHQHTFSQLYALYPNVAESTVRHAATGKSWRGTYEQFMDEWEKETTCAHT